MVLKNKLALSTSCLGLHPSHSLDSKLHAAAKHGFSGIEIVYSDLEQYSNLHKLPITSAASKIQRLCTSLNLRVLALVPFENFEGSTTPLQQRLEVAQEWITIARILKATYIQVPAQFSKDASTDEQLIVSELQQLADLASAAEPIISIAYEPMGWSIRHSTWESALHLSEQVNRPNFGVCLDSFHIASKTWGDPSVPSGKQPNADRKLSDSMERLIKDFPLERIFYIQLSDGERFDPLYSKEHPWYLEGEDKQFTWSKHARPFPLETELGGYMPVVEITRAWLLEMGFKGWVSLETFDRRMREAEFDPEMAASRAESSIRRLEESIDPTRSRL